MPAESNPAARDPAGLDPDGLDPHELDPHELDPDGLDPHGRSESADAVCDRATWSALDEARLSAVAEALGTALVPGDVVLLSGPMGAGKTTFTRALARGLNLRRPDAVRSPTFNICVEHDGERPLAHIDLFRLAQGTGEETPAVSTASVGAAAFEALGLSALLDEDEARAVIVVEWGELWQGPPATRLDVTLTIADEGEPGRDVRGAGAHGGRHDDRDATTRAPGGERRHIVAVAHGAPMRRRLAQWRQRCG